MRIKISVVNGLTKESLIQFFGTWATEWTVDGKEDRWPGSYSLPPLVLVLQGVFEPLNRVVHPGHDRPEMVRLCSARKRNSL